MIPELTEKDISGLDRCLDRIKAGVSVFQTHGHPVKHRPEKWDMDGMVGIPSAPYHAIQPHTPWFTDP